MKRKLAKESSESEGKKHHWKIFNITFEAVKRDKSRENKIHIVEDRLEQATQK